MDKNNHYCTTHIFLQKLIIIIVMPIMSWVIFYKNPSEAWKTERVYSKPNYNMIPREGCQKKKIETNSPGYLYTVFVGNHIYVMVLAGYNA